MVIMLAIPLAVDAVFEMAEIINPRALALRVVRISIGMLMPEPSSSHKH
jgi:hypothetical protein